MKGRFKVAIMLAFLSGATSVALGAPDRSEILIKEGVELRRRGQDGQALERFQTAYELTHTPRAAIQLGLCEMALGRWLDSESHLTEGLASSVPWVSSNRAIFDGAREKVRAKLVKVVIAGGPPGATVRVSDQAVGILPNISPVYAAPGDIVVAATASGYIEQLVTNSARAGESISVTIDLKPRPKLDSLPREAVSIPPRQEVRVEPTVPARQAPSVPPAGVQTSPVQAASTPSSDSSWQRTGAFVAGSLAAASLVLGGASHLMRHAAASDFADAARGCDNSGGVVLGGAACEDIARRFDRSNNLMIAGYVGAAALATTAVILWITGGAHEGQGTSAVSACAPALVGASLFCAVFF